MNSTEEIDLDELLNDIVTTSNDSELPKPKNTASTSASVSFPSIKTGGINKATMFSKSPEAIGEKKRDPSEVDLSIREFETVDKFYNDTPHSLFDSTEFYKVLLKGEGESAQRLHTSLTKFLTATDPKDRGVFRQQVESNYWNFVSDMVAKIASGKASKEKKYACKIWIGFTDITYCRTKKFIRQNYRRKHLL